MNAGNSLAVSIIVPARNEEACLGACLESLLAQTGIAFEIMVVNDDSTDRTSQIARSFAGVKVIEAGPLPDRWTGKNNAMAAGARHTKGKWLLFTDADTVHKPGSLARAVAEAEQHGAALLSYSPEQEIHGFWEKAVMPVIFAELAATYPQAKVNDPASPLAAANGQYLLIARAPYDAVGGHANPKIAGSLLEDVAMARLVKASGRKIFFRYGGDAVRTRMYRTFAQLQEGWTKNLALLFSPAWSVACWRLSEFILVPSMVAAAFAFTSIGGFYNLGLQPVLLALAVLFLFWRRIRAAHFPASSIAMAFCGLPIFAYLLLRSARRQKQRTVAWKNRTYAGSQPAARASTAYQISGAAILFLAVQIPFFVAAIFIFITYGDRIFHHR